ncbi:MAG: sdrD 1 [Phycisphaerales bacterium]|nr:sdrD 1 [Phycisphaerales bacterium]
MKLNKAVGLSGTKRIGKLRRACEEVVGFEGLEERRLMTAVFHVINTADDGPGSLRQAIAGANNSANASDGPDRIEFNILDPMNPAAFKIELQSKLPALTEAVTIDGTTEPGFAGTPLIWLDGSLGISGGNPFAGLQIQGGGSTIRGLALTSFDGAIRLSGGDGDTVTGCYIGFDPTAAVPDRHYANYSFGIEVDNSMSTINANVIALNNNDGIFVTGTHATITGNLIGTDPTGTVGRGNGSDGIRLDGVGDVTIGGTGPGEGNVIAANFSRGINVNNSTAVQIIGNTIGGTFVGEDNLLGNQSDGIALTNITSSSGATPQVLINSNLIASNEGDGIRLTEASGVVITGNVIGSGVDSGNQADGIGLDGTSSGNRIGGIGAGEGNVITYNHGSGITIYRQLDPELSGVNNAIRGNSMHDNGIGIDLTELADFSGPVIITSSGPTPNGRAGHIGPNNYQNFPVIAQASRNTTSGNVTVRGSLDASINTTYEIDLFGNQAASPTGIGEGEQYLGTVTVTTDAHGHGTFMKTFTHPDPKYVVITATATDSAGNTSEFSEFSQVADAASVASTTALTTSQNPSTYGMAVTFTATVTGSDAGSPSGLVTFMDGNQVLGTVALDANGQAFFCTSMLMAGNHSIIAIYGGDAQYGGSTSAALAETVNAKVLTITVNDASKTYGSANPAFGAHADGFVLGEDLSALAGSLGFYTGATASSGAGSYMVCASGLTASNYSITYVDGSLLVDKAVLKVTANDASKTYGEANPNFTASYIGFVNGDGAASLGGTLVISTPGVHAGTFALTATGQTSSNYAINYVDGVLTINKASLTVTADDQSNVYGAAVPTLTATYRGFVNGGSAASLTAPAALATTANSASNAGSYFITASGAASSDYDISFVAGTLTINKATLTVIAGDASKIYGTATPSLTAAYIGFVNSDTAATSLSQPVALGMAAGAGINVGNYAITASGAASTNYTITYVGGTLAVTPAALTVTVNNASRAYGQANPAFGLGYIGFVSSDSASSLGGAAVFATAATSSSTVGGYSINATGLSSINYVITYAPGTLTVVQAGTTTTLSSSASSSNPGQTVTFTATVIGSPASAPSGTVTFFDNSTSLASVELVNGVATLITSGLAAGGHTITATYNGSTNYTTSSSAPLSQTVTASLTISGSALKDVTGNGLSSDDTPMAGVTVNLYTDTDHNGVLSAADQIVDHTISGAKGAYTFTAQPGTYFIGEVTPTGYLQTGPAMPLYYTLNAANGGASTGNDFDNFLVDCDTHDVTNVSYLINGTTVVDQLRGSVHQGDTVQVIFTVPSGAATHQFSFVSYTAPGSTFDADNAHQQMIYNSDTGVFGPGVHSLTVTAPDAYFQIDFVCGEIIDHLGPAGSNIFYTPQGRLLGADNGGTQAPINAPSSISGFVYLDTNNNGSIDILDGVIAGVKVTLSGTDDCGRAVSMVEFTDADGRYFFGGLRPGTYSILESQPTGVSDGKDTLGSIANSAASSFGTASNDRFSNIRIVASRDGINYNFGEVGSAVHRGQTAAIGFWQNSNGQALLKCLNNGSTDTNLGIWLAANFPNLYGQNAGAASLLGKSNAQIAAFYTTLYKTTAQKLDAQVLALAFATYVTDAQLAGTVARNYNFEVSDAGVGAATYNVGSNGAAFGVANNSTVAVSQLLQIADNKSWNGTLWDADHSGTLSATESNWRNMAYTIFNAINNAGGL